MQYAVFDSRSRAILDYLASQSDYKTVSDIAESLACSKNSVQYSLAKIADLLLEEGQEALEKKRRAGLRLCSAHKAWWREFQKKQAELDYSFTRDERSAVIIVLIILERQRFSVDQAGALLHVSRNTVFADLRNARESLLAYQVRLNYDTRLGYSLQGDEFTLRSLLVHYFTSLLRPLVDQGVLALFDAKHFQEHKQRFAEIQRRLELEYVPGVLSKLALLMLYIDSGNADQPRISGEEAQGIRASGEYGMLGQLYPDLPEAERLYMSSQLLGSRILHPYTHIELSDRQSLAHARNLVLYFERLTGLVLHNNEGLLHELATHVSRALYRYKFSIPLPHQSPEESAQGLDPEYSGLYAVIKLAAGEFSRDIGYPIDDAEAILLASYFFRHMHPLPFQIAQTPALLVVDGKPEDFAPLREDIAAGFPMLDLARVISAEEFYRLEPGSFSAGSSPEVLLSTVSLRSGRPYALVSDPLDRQSRDMVYRCYQQCRLGRSLAEVDDLMGQLRPYLLPDAHTEARNAVLAFLYGKAPSLREILLPEYVSTGLKADNWERAVRRAAQPLLEQDAIRGGYVEELIRSITMYGSYSYIFDGVYLAHADAVPEVKRLALGLATFAEPVLFPGDKPVRLLLVLCPRDKHTHFAAFKELMDICGRDGLVDALLRAASPAALLRILNGNGEKDGGASLGR